MTATIAPHQSVVFAPPGSLDGHSAPHLLAEIDAAIVHNGVDLVIDLAAVTAVGPAGVAVLAETRRRLATAAGTLYLRHPSRRVAGCLRDTGLIG